MIRGVKHKARGPELAQQRPGGARAHTHTREMKRFMKFQFLGQCQILFRRQCVLLCLPYSP